MRTRSCFWVCIEFRAGLVVHALSSASVWAAPVPGHFSGVKVSALSPSPTALSGERSSTNAAPTAPFVIKVGCGTRIRPRPSQTSRHARYD